MRKEKERWETGQGAIEDTIEDAGAIEVEGADADADTNTNTNTGVTRNAVAVAVVDEDRPKEPWQAGVLAGRPRRTICRWAVAITDSKGTAKGTMMTPGIRATPLRGRPRKKEATKWRQARGPIPRKRG